MRRPEDRPGTRHQGPTVCVRASGLECWCARPLAKSPSCSPQEGQAVNRARRKRCDRRCLGPLVAATDAGHGPELDEDLVLPTLLGRHPGANRTWATTHSIRLRPVVSCRPSTVPITARRGAPGQPMMVLLAIPFCSGEPPPRRRRRTSAREQKRNKPRPTGPHWTNQTHRYRAQNAPARTQQHGSELWSPVRDEEAAGSNPVTPTSVSAGESPTPELVGASFAASTAAKRGQYSNKPEL